MARLNPITSDCLFALRLNEPNATDNALDASGNGRHFTQSGNPDVVAGVFDGARGILDAAYHTAKRFTLADEPALRAQQFAVAGWVKPLADQWWNDRSAGLIGKLYTGISGVDYSWKINAWWVGDGSTYHYLTFDLRLTDGVNWVQLQAFTHYPLLANAWVHVVASWDGEYATLWINGRPWAKSRVAAANLGWEIPYDAKPMQLGRAAAYLDYGYHADVCDWALYSTSVDDEWAYNQYNDAALPDELPGVIPYVPGKTVVLYRADEESPGECLRDATGNARHMTGWAAPRTATGYRNGARDLDRHDVTPEGTQGPNFRLWHETAWHSDVLTAIAIYRPPLAGKRFSSGYVSMFSKTNSWNLAFESEQTSLKPEFRVRLSGGTIYARSPTQVSREEWHIFVGTFDGTWVRIYCDKVLLASTQNTTGTTDINVDAATWYYIGGGNGPRGLIDEVSLLNVALTWEEILALFAPTLTPVDPLHLQIDVSLDSAIEMRLFDADGTIADGWTVDVQRYTGAAWERAFTHGVGAGSGWGALLTPITGGYELTLTHAVRLPPSSRVSVRVTAVDNEGIDIVLA
jgi:hypothetical protein